MENNKNTPTINHTDEFIASIMQDTLQEMRNRICDQDSRCPPEVIAGIAHAICEMGERYRSAQADL